MLTPGVMVISRPELLLAMSRFLVLLQLGSVFMSMVYVTIWDHGNLEHWNWKPHWAHPVLHGRVCPTLRRDAPIPHHGNGGADLSDMGLGGLVLSLAWGGVPSCPDWPNQISLRPTSSALVWMTLIIYSIYDLLDCGKDCSCWTIASGSLWLRTTAGYPRGALVRVQW